MLILKKGGKSSHDGLEVEQWSDNRLHFALGVVYFNQLSGACSTLKLVETFFSAVFRNVIQDMN